MNHQSLLKASGVDVSRETFDKLTGFHRAFLAWSKRINIVAPSTATEFWERHVLDSLQLLALRPSSKSWIDLGSGGGFPGMVLAIALNDCNDSRVTLVESNRKKCAFLQAMRAQFAPRCVVLAKRIEETQSLLSVPDVVTARALADLSQLLSFSHTWLDQGAVGLFLKGRGYDGEIENSRAQWAYDLVKHNSCTDADAAILEITNLRRLVS